MDRKVAKDITIDCLFERNPNGNFYANVFEEFLNSKVKEDHIPVSPIEFQNVNDRNDNVYISENVYNELAAIQDITAKTKSELPYFMIGWEKPDGSIIFDTIYSDKKQTSNVECDYNTITHYVEKFLLELKPSEIKEHDKPIICKGHSHGNSSKFADNFSFADVINCVIFKDSIRDFLRYNSNGFDSNIVDTTDMLLNPCGDFNMIYYDDRPQNRGFYKFNNLRIKANNGDIIPLPTMSNDGNYIVKGTKNNIR